VIDAWVEELCAALDVPREAVDVQALLDLARDAAHLVERPAAPVTTYIVGFAAARGGGSPDAVSEASRRAAELARRWGNAASP
jgi:Domain of unknown function (DUF6457)